MNSWYQWMNNANPQQHHWDTIRKRRANATARSCNATLEKPNSVALHGGMSRCNKWLWWYLYSEECLCWQSFCVKGPKQILILSQDDTSTRQHTGTDIATQTHTVCHIHNVHTLLNTHARSVGEFETEFDWSQMKSKRGLKPSLRKIHLKVTQGL